ncbi:MAG TPA: sugar phosphate isomerase/epimerase family protein [bacterium]|nr:sugar phosphate isomerase/epimerase family protein [bacterium]
MKNVLQMNYWTIGGFHAETPVEKALREIKKMGLDGLELTYGAGEFAPGITENKCRELRRIAKELSVKIVTCGTDFYMHTPLASTSKAKRKKSVEFSKRYFNDSAMIGAKICLVVPGSVWVPWDSKQPVVPYKTVWENSLEGVNSVIPAARDAGVKIGIENVWNGFVTDPIALKTFIDQFKSNWVGSYFDAGNCIINGFPQHWIEILGKRIIAVHIKNFKRNDYAGGLHCFGDNLLEGDLDFTAVKRALQKVKYQGPITVEMVPFSREPNLVLPDMKLAYDTAKKMLKLFR